MRVGDVIKYERIKLQVTQEELCKDICSVSYLSKIENGATTPSNEIIELLFHKLNIDFFQVNDEKSENDRRLSLIHIYQDLIEKKKNIDEGTVIAELTGFKTVTQNKILSELILARFYLSKKKTDEADQIIMKLETIIDNYYSHEKFIFYKNKGLLYYLNGDYRMALNNFQCCLTLLSSAKFPGWDLADLYFQVALTNGRLQKVQESIEFASKALVYYDKDYNYLRSADCQMILGISYQRLENYEFAIKSYSLALKIGETFQNYNLMSAINHNLGYLKSLESDYEVAKIHFKKSLKLREPLIKEGVDDIKKLLNTIHSLIQLHYKEGNITEAQIYIEKGEKYLSSCKNVNNYEHQLHYNVYKKLIIDEEDSIRYLEDHVLPYFIERSNSRYIYKYSKLLAEIFETERKYKKSVYFYKLANHTAQSLIPKTYIE
ncbi:helix-turn-helix transcriptional regulator [Priestia koreensis]|uniref:helix-turn-helix transcriptional regulator n=1 Tax=Priestia koreensis TaxID=284581 RepID=UPI001F590394|nr:helix-turn-helix transcriptional regulator [Priestia koreensis]UNL87541.1 helix-turn-helix transcriptional regulator [Priestia koreensis]